MDTDPRTVELTPEDEALLTEVYEWVQKLVEDNYPPDPNELYLLHRFDQLLNRILPAPAGKQPSR